MKKLLLLTLLLGACQSNPKVVVGVNAEYAPFEYLDGDKIIGFNAEVLEAVMSNANIDFQWEDMSFDGLLPALQSKKVDAVIGAQNTEERKLAVNFTDIYYYPQQVLVVHKDSAFSINDLSGKKLSAQLGTMQEVLARNIEGAIVSVYPNYTGALLDLENQKIDGIIIAKLSAQEYIKQSQNLMILGNITNPDESLGYAIALNKDSDELLKKLNVSLAEVIASGKVAEIHTKYLGD